MKRRSIVINGKFIGAGLNGVHRTAAHYASALIERAAPICDVRLVAPKPAMLSSDFPLLIPEVHRGIFGSGQGWEMLTLPAVARGALLVNFCNLGPILHRRSVVMIHDAQTFIFPNDYTGLQAAGYRTLLPWIGQRASRVLTVSSFSRHSLAEHGIASLDKIDVIHNGTDHIHDIPTDPDLLTRLGLTSGSYVMTLGNIKEYKNIQRVFAAMRQLSDLGIPLVVAGGPGEERYRAAGWTPPDGTIFTGFVSDGELRHLYEAAKLFAFPSLTEGFGLPPIEAMQCGTPVVAARAGAMPEVCGDAAILVEPQDTAAWAQAMAKIFHSPEHAAALSARGKAHAQHLSWEAAGDRLWKSIEPLV